MSSDPSGAPFVSAPQTWLFPAAPGPLWTRRVDWVVVGFLWLSPVLVPGVCLVFGEDPVGWVHALPRLADAPEMPTGAFRDWIPSGVVGLAVLVGLMCWCCFGAAGGPTASEPSPPTPMRDVAKVFAVWVVTSWAWMAWGGAAEVFGLLLSAVGASGLAAGYGLVLWRMRGGSWAVLTRGFTPADFRATFRRALVWHFRAFPLILILMLANDALFGPDSGQKVLCFLLWLGERPLALVTVMAAMVVVGPVAEEVMFRLTLQNALGRGAAAAWRIAGSGVAFALIHAEMRLILPLTAMGCFWAWRREASGGLAEPILLHVLNNAWTFFMLLLLLAV